MAIRFHLRNFPPIRLGSICWHFISFYFIRNNLSNFAKPEHISPLNRDGCPNQTSYFINFRIDFAVSQAMLHFIRLSTVDVRLGIVIQLQREKIKPRNECTHEPPAN